MHDALVEGIVVGDDDLMERYLGDETIEIDELAARARRAASRRRRVFPVLCGSATKLIGIDRLAHVPRRGSARARTSTTGQPAALVFKTIVDPYVGHVNLFKVLQGTVKHDDVLVERPHACRRAPAPALHDARQGAGARSPRSRPATSPRSPSSPTPTTGDVLAREGHDGRGRAVRARPSRVLAVAIHAKSQGRRGQARQRAAPPAGRGPGAAPRAQRRDAPDAAARAWARRTSSIALEKLARKFGVEVETEDVQVAVPRDDHRHGRGRGQVQEADRRPRPVRGRVAAGRAAASAARASSSSTRSSAARSPASSSPRSRRASHETMEHGGALGFPVVDVKVTCFDGKHHSGRQLGDGVQDRGARSGFKEAMAKADPILLEPVSELVVTVPEANQGDIMGDLNAQARPHPGLGVGRRRRGRDRRARCRRRRSCATRSTCAR